MPDMNPDITVFCVEFTQQRLLSALISNPEPSTSGCGTGGAQASIRPTPCTLRLAPYPQPCTLRPARHTLHPSPRGVHAFKAALVGRLALLQSPLIGPVQN